MVLSASLFSGFSSSKTILFRVGIVGVLGFKLLFRVEKITSTNREIVQNMP